MSNDSTTRKTDMDHTVSYKADYDNNSNEKWLVDIMKSLSAAQSIKDVKHICCELIGRVVDLSKRIDITSEVKENQQINDNTELKGDINKLAEHYDNEIQEIKNDNIRDGENDNIRDGEFATKEEIDKVKEKVDDLEGRSRHNNIRISNLQEGTETGYSDSTPVERIMESIIKDALGIRLPPGSVQ